MKTRRASLVVIGTVMFFTAFGGALKKHFSKGEQSENINIEESKTSEELGNSVAEPAAEQPSTPPLNDHNKNDGDSSSPEPVAPPTPPASVLPSHGTPDAKTEKKKISGDPVILRINGRKEFRRSDILAILASFPPQVLQHMPPEKLYELSRDQLLNSFLLVEQGRKRGLDQSKQYLDELARFKDDLLVRILIAIETSPHADNETELKAKYTKYLVEFKKGNEFLLQHILVSTEEEAKGILDELKKGSDFAELARKHSIAPSKSTGGDEGFISITDIQQPIRDQLTPLKKNEYTTQAIQASDGYHILKLLDTRESKPQSFEEAAQMLRRAIVYEYMSKLLDRLKKGARIEYFSEEGTPVSRPDTVPATQ
ncbi:MAG: peptidyl-prolyl cis-trans isomerase [Holosporaceae bacterium]|nr:peptidyl-prolyl cis-trans isomerase [Holosporaceae bacterium]